jgi:hypothetical protein
VDKKLETFLDFKFLPLKQSVVLFFYVVVNRGKGRAEILLGVNRTIVNTDYIVIIESSKFIDIQLILYILNIAHDSFVLDINPSTPNIHIQVQVDVD